MYAGNSNSKSIGLYLMVKVNEMKFHEVQAYVFVE